MMAGPHPRSLSLGGSAHCQGCSRSCEVGPVDRQSRAAVQLGQREPDGAEGGLLAQSHHFALRSERRQQKLHLIVQPWHAVEHAARQHKREVSLAELQLRHHCRCRRHQLVRRAIQDACGDHIAIVSRELYVLRHGRNRPRVQLLVIDLADQIAGARDAEVREETGREARDAAAAIGVPDDGAQRETADPVAAVTSVPASFFSMTE
jgi:hypothetical protein